MLVDILLMPAGLPVPERKVRVCIPGQEEPQTDQLDRLVQTQAQEGPVCKSCLLINFIVVLIQWAWSPLHKLGILLNLNAVLIQWAWTP